MSPYRELAELAEEELRLARAERWAELGSLAIRRAALIGELPPVPPPSAEPLLRRTLVVQEAITAILAAARDHVAGELLRLDRGRRGVQAYAGPSAAPERMLDRAV